MAKPIVIKLTHGSPNAEEHPTPEMEMKSRIDIAHSEGDSFSEELTREFEDVDGVKIWQLEGVKGGGGDWMPLMQYIFLGLSISIGFASKSFFEELGKNAAQKLIKLLADKNDTSALNISSGPEAGPVREFYVLVPANCTLKDCEKMMDLVDAMVSLGKDDKLLLLFDPLTRRLIDITPSGWRR